MKPIIFLNSHPIQYFVPLYQQITKENKVGLMVWYCSDATLKGNQVDKGFGKTIQWDIPLLEGYKSVFINNNSPAFLKKKQGFFSIINLGIFNLLRSTSPSIIIVHGWKYFSFVYTILIARFFGHKVIIRGETPLNQEKLKNSSITFFKHLYLRFLFLFADHALFIGKQNKLFYQHLGFKQNKLTFAPYCVDNARFQEVYKTSGSAEARKKFNLPSNKKIILFSGKYISKKRPMDLLEAFKALNDSNLLLVMVGEGELRLQMEAFAEKNNLQQNVVLTGFINQSLIPFYYLAADVFVMCSGLGETWGLSVNEAMNFGLPVIVSDTCGSAYDLIEEGVNGSMFETGNIAQLTAALKTYLYITEEEKRTVAAGALKIINGYSYKQIIQSLETLAGAKEPINN